MRPFTTLHANRCLSVLLQYRWQHDRPLNRRRLCCYIPVLNPETLNMWTKTTLQSSRFNAFSVQFNTLFWCFSIFGTLICFQSSARCSQSVDSSFHSFFHRQSYFICFHNVLTFTDTKDKHQNEPSHEWAQFLSHAEMVKVFASPLIKVYHREWQNEALPQRSTSRLGFSLVAEAPDKPRTPDLVFICLLKSKSSIWKPFKSSGSSETKTLHNERTTDREAGPAMKRNYRKFIDTYANFKFRTLD